MALIALEARIDEVSGILTHHAELQSCQQIYDALKERMNATRLLCCSCHDSSDVCVDQAAAEVARREILLILKPAVLASVMLLKSA